MGYVERRSGHWRARYRDPLGRQRSETFARKVDADRFLPGPTDGCCAAAPTR